MDIQKPAVNRAIILVESETGREIGGTVSSLSQTNPLIVNAMVIDDNKIRPYFAKLIPHFTVGGKSPEGFVWKWYSEEYKESK